MIRDLMAARTNRTQETDLATTIHAMFDPLVRPLERLRKNPRRAASSPQTTLERLKRDIEMSVQRQGDEGMFGAPFRRLLDFVPSVEVMQHGMQERIGLDREELHNDPIGTQLLRLYDAADASGPVSPMKFVCKTTDDEAIDIFTVAGKFLDADRSRGEKRVRILLEAMPDLLEKVYRRYLRTVWILSCLASGTWPSKPSMGIGALVKDLGPRVRAYTGLVDDDAGLLRNAVAHRHIEYLPAKRSVKFSAPPIGWQLTLTQKHLESRLLSMWRLATTLKSRLASISSAEFFLRSGMLTQLPRLRDALQGDVEAAEALTEKTHDAALRAELIRQNPPPGTNLWFLSQEQAE